jgi:hypothetical protein
MAALKLQGGQVQLQNQKRDEVTAPQLHTLDTRRQGLKTKMPEGDDSISVLKEGKERGGSRFRT